MKKFVVCSMVFLSAVNYPMNKRPSFSGSDSSVDSTPPTSPLSLDCNAQKMLLGYISDGWDAQPSVSTKEPRVVVKKAELLARALLAHDELAYRQKKGDRVSGCLYPMFEGLSDEELKLVFSKGHTEKLFLDQQPNGKVVAINELGALAFKQMRDYLISTGISPRDVYPRIETMVREENLAQPKK